MEEPRKSSVWKPSTWMGWTDRFNHWRYVIIAFTMSVLFKSIDIAWSTMQVRLALASLSRIHWPYVTSPLSFLMSIPSWPRTVSQYDALHQSSSRSGIDNITYYECDVSKWEQVEAVSKKVVEEVSCAVPSAKAWELKLLCTRLDTRLFSSTTLALFRVNSLLISLRRI